MATLNLAEYSYKLTLDSAEYTEKMRQAGQQAEEMKGKLGGFGNSLASSLKVGFAAVGTVAAAAGAAAVSLAKNVISSFGELEQNLGGSEAVFGEYAANIQKIGEDAYKNMGISQSQYLATANKMGALFQGSGIEQQKSLDLTTEAMQRAADMAFVMGIDMQSALDSVAAGAKGNYTMFDNLGVAINATNLEAYALSQGITTAYKDMSQTEKVELAMQMFLERTSQYAGNFAKESTETISGSMGLMKASVESFIGGLGNADADMMNLTQNMVDAFSAVMDNIIPVLENIVSALPTATSAILAAIGDLLPMLLQTVIGIFGQVLETILTLLPQLIPAAVQAVLTMTTAIIDNLPLFIDAAVQMVTSIVSGLGEALPTLIPAAVQAVITIVQGLADNIPMLIDAALQLITGLARGLITAIPFIVEAMPQIINSIINALVGAIPLIIEVGVELFVALIENLPFIITEIVKAVPRIVTGLVSAIGSLTYKMVEAGGNLLRGLWEGISGAASWLWEKVSGWASGLIEGVRGVFDIHSPSRVFADIGENLALGLGGGFNNEMDSVTASMLKKVAGFTPQIKGLVSLAGVGGGFSSTAFMPRGEQAFRYYPATNTNTSTEHITLNMPLTINGSADESILKAIKAEHSSIVSDAVKAISTKSVNAVKFGSGLPIRAI